MKSSKNKIQVAIAMGSRSDLKVMKEATKALKLFGIRSSMHILSAHRTPKEMSQFAEGARASGIRVIIAGAGGAAHLPGMMAAYSELPVIGVPVPIGPLKGLDALLSIAQMPAGVPVATVAIGNAFNAGLLAAQILAASGETNLFSKIKKYKVALHKKVRKSSKKL